jgi:hypothetical protein
MSRLASIWKSRSSGFNVGAMDTTTKFKVDHRPFAARTSQRSIAAL